MKTKEQVLEIAIDLIKATKGKKNTAITLRAVLEEIKKEIKA